MDCTRRSMLGGAVAATALGCAHKLLALPEPRPFFERIGHPIGVQLHTLGDEAGTNLLHAFKSLAEIGYRDVELPQLFGQKAAHIGQAAREAGIEISSVHVPVSSYGVGDALSLERSSNELADTLMALGATHAIVPLAAIPAGFNPEPGSDVLTALAHAFGNAGVEPWQRTAQILNDKAAVLKPMGISLGYHNHNIEFAPIGSTTGWDVLVEECDTSLVSFEVDTGWVASAGLDPANLIERHRGRVKHLHIKDVALGLTPNFALFTKSTPIGSGTLNWERVLRAAEIAGVEHFYVELEAPFAVPRIEALRLSHDYLARLAA